MVRLIRLVLLVSLIVTSAGVSTAITNPKSVAAAPFRGIAVKVLEISAVAMDFIKDARTVAATHERNVVSTSLHAMIIMEGISETPTVSVPTNDMTNFPNSEHPLYPEYLETRYSEFKYTVGSHGEVILDATDATADPILADILQAISSIKEVEQDEAFTR
ncbi:MAG: hypothetical protein ABIB93_04045 [Chloroflexota bacterium]